MTANSTSSPPKWLHLRLVLRPDLRCTLQTSAGKSYYQVEDPLSGRFYRLGLREWKLAGKFDGRLTIAELVANLRRESTRDALGQQDALSLCQWLLQVQMVVPPRNATSVVAAARRKSTPPWWTNPLFIRLPLCGPDRWLERMLPWFGWTISPPAVIGWCVLLAFAAATLFTEWSRFAAPLSSILAPDNWLYLLLAWAGLKVIHEFYHGLICKKYGGHVASCGLMLIMFSPVAYVDVTSSWRFRSKWQRIFTAAGGMYAEFLVASLAVLVWARTDSPLVAQICHNLITMASVSTLLFNGNFLMKYDGYYIVSDLLELPNLYTSGQQYIRYLTRRYLLGVPAAPLSDTKTRRRMIQTYAILSFGWRCLFYAGILFTAASLFHGAGIVFAVAMGLSWFFGPIATFARYVIWGAGTEQPQRWRFGLVVGTAIGLVIVLAQSPWPSGLTAAGVVDYEPLEVVRVENPGFVRQIHVKPGESVQQGQVLVTLENPETAQQLADLEIAIRQSEVRERMLRGAGQYAHQQVEEKHRESLVKQREELRAKFASLTIRAPRDGRVIIGEMDTLQDQYLPSGQVLFSVGNEERKAIYVAVPQRDAEVFLRHVGTQPRVRVQGRSELVADASLSRVNPRATRHLSHPALAAPFGGPLAVIAGTQADQTNPFELVEPHFEAIVSLPAVASASLRAGELAKIRLQIVHETIGQHLWSQMEEWIGQKLGETY